MASNEDPNPKTMSSLMAACKQYRVVDKRGCETAGKMQAMIDQTLGRPCYTL